VALILALDTHIALHKVEVHAEVEVEVVLLASGSLIIFKWVFSCGSYYFELSTQLKIEALCDSLGRTYLDSTKFQVLLS